jgi:hypothetical protein
MFKITGKSRKEMKSKTVGKEAVVKKEMKVEEKLDCEDAVIDFAKTLLMGQLCTGHAFPLGSQLESLVGEVISHAAQHLDVGAENIRGQCLTSCTYSPS